MNAECPRQRIALQHRLQQYHFEAPRQAGLFQGSKEYAAVAEYPLLLGIQVALGIYEA